MARRIGVAPARRPPSRRRRPSCRRPRGRRRGHRRPRLRTGRSAMGARPHRPRRGGRSGSSLDARHAPRDDRPGSRVLARGGAGRSRSRRARARRLSRGRRLLAAGRVHARKADEGAGQLGPARPGRSQPRRGFPSRRAASATLRPAPIIPSGRASPASCWALDGATILPRRRYQTNSKAVVAARQEARGGNSVGRVPAFQAGCRGFESRPPPRSTLFRPAWWGG